MALATAADAGIKTLQDVKGKRVAWIRGAPALNNDIWVYGGTRTRIVETLTEGRNGRMPAHENFLGPAKVHVLAAYVYSFTRGNAPNR